MVVLTGAIDYISDGVRVVSLHNGHKVLGQITGAGCVVGSCIASYCATAALLDEDEDGGRIVRGDMFMAAVAGYVFVRFLLRFPGLIIDRILVLTISTELAMKREGVKGPGTFLPGLIDVLWSLEADEVMTEAKITVY